MDSFNWEFCSVWTSWTVFPFICMKLKGANCSFVVIFIKGVEDFSSFFFSFRGVQVAAVCLARKTNVFFFLSFLLLTHFSCLVLFFQHHWEIFQPSISSFHIHCNYQISSRSKMNIDHQAMVIVHPGCDVVWYLNFSVGQSHCLQYIFNLSFNQHH